MDRAAQRPSFGPIQSIDHITLWVSNAKQAAAFYTSRFGFEYFMYKGLQTGERDASSHAIRSSDGVIFVICSAYSGFSSQAMNQHIITHGDSVRDIAFSVENSAAVYQNAIKHGAIALRYPTKLQDKDGRVVVSTVRAYGNTTHTFVERKKYNGAFLPGFLPHYKMESMNKVFRPIRFEKIDSICAVQFQFIMEEVVKFYEKCMGFHRCWHLDEKHIPSDCSHLPLKSTVVTDYDENIKLKVCESVPGKRKTPSHEFLEYFNAPGVQQISLRTENIIETVENMRARGVDFLPIPDTYYDNLRKNKPELCMKLPQNIDLLQRNKILIDFDEKGYMLQIFTKPVQDRPTLYFEIVQRRNFDGFGFASINTLTAALEQEQSKRGNLTDMI